jgi:uncharacterized protein (TIGR00251 family)
VRRTFFELTKEGARIFLRATPGAARNEIAGLWRDADGEPRLSVKVTAAPDKGKANQSIIKLLSSALGLPKSSLSITAGETGRLKTLFVAGDASQVAKCLSQFAGDADER